MAQVSAAVENLLRRDRAVVLAALAALVALAWAYTAAMAIGMHGASMGGMDGMGAMPWSAGYFAAAFAMWAVMMAGMMLPSAAPAILLFSALRRHAPASLAHPLLFMLGYLVAWTGFSVLATTAQWALSQAGWLSPAMTSASPALAGALFFAAGLYQLSPLKRSCLAKCRSPAQFLVERRRAGRTGAVLMGIHHGLYCVGCCWALMALLFAFGVMNLLWVAALAAFVLAEKLFPAGARIGTIGGLAMMGIGLVLLNA